jgi:N-acetylneuraminate synthase/N,N'-diacetyllegionaminate synthase
MKLFNKDSSKEIIVIAEIGVNHMGSLNWIIKMLPKVKSAGADAIKFQLFTPDLYASKSNIERYQQVSKLTLSKEDFLKIKKRGDNIGLPVFATPVSHDWVSFIADTCGVLKIASGDFTFMPTVEAALKTSAQILISTGGTTRDEIKVFVDLAKSLRTGNKYSESLAMLHCISSYPAPVIESNLSAIPDLSSLTGLTIGFSSHFMQDAPLFAALALGARIFEIHITDDRSRKDIRDHALSRTPIELQDIVNTLAQLNISLLSGEKTIQPSEEINLNTMRKGIVYRSDLPIGHTISLLDLEYARPFNPALPSVASLEGKKLKRAVKAGYSAVEDDLLTN